MFGVPLCQHFPVQVINNFRRYFNWRISKVEDEDHHEDEELSTFESTSQHSSSRFPPRGQEEKHHEDLFKSCLPTGSSGHKKKLPLMTAAKFRSAALSLFGYRNRSNSCNAPPSLGTKVIGTIFGHRRGHIHIAFQEDPKSSPAFLIELSTPTSTLVKEMASGLVRVALECDRKAERKGLRLLEEPLWRVYCNGKKRGYAMRHEYGTSEELSRVLKAVEPISMGAGVLPRDKDADEDGSREEGKTVFLRAKFERVVGSRDSEALYMMNPDRSGCPEFSIYLIRVPSVDMNFA